MVPGLTDVYRGIRVTNQWPMPAWHDSVPEPDKQAACVRLLLSLAAIYATEAGTLGALAAALDEKPEAIRQARARGRITPEIAIKIETLLGRERFPREIFRPDLFVIAS